MNVIVSIPPEIAGNGPLYTTVLFAPRFADKFVLLRPVLVFPVARTGADVVDNEIWKVPPLGEPPGPLNPPETGKEIPVNV